MTFIQSKHGWSKLLESIINHALNRIFRHYRHEYCSCSEIPGTAATNEPRRTGEQAPCHGCLATSLPYRRYQAPKIKVLRDMACWTIRVSQDHKNRRSR